MAGDRGTQTPLIPLTLLTGFLGSGKTTVLNHLVHQPAMARALVIINEFGAVGLDHLLVTPGSESTVIEMSSGCLCCTIRGDLARTLRDLTNRYADEAQSGFNHVVIETTGLADPAPIIQTLMLDTFIASHYRLDGIVTTVDLATAEQTLDTYAEAIKQVAVADCLLLTKADLVTADAADALLRRLRGINPAARCRRVHLGEIDASDVLQLGLFGGAGRKAELERWLNPNAYNMPEHDHDHDHDHHKHDINRHDDHIKAFCFVRQAWRAAP